jgi:hypothetical protein
MIDLDKLELRDLQKESARALSVMEATNNNIYKYNIQAYHNSQNWYKAVIKDYINQYGDLPSKTGPANSIILILD